MHNITAKNAFGASLLIAAFVLALLAPKASVNVDEQMHYPHAKNVVNWYFTGGEDVSCLNTPVTNLKYYGQSVDNLTALINRVFNIKNELLTRHYTGALFFFLLLLFAGLLAYEATGSYWVSVITVISVFITPRLFGQAFGNLKDIPFATGYIASVYMIVRFIKQLPEPAWKTAIGLGVAIAYTNSVRIGGLVLFAYLGFALLFTFISKPFLLKHIVSTKLCFFKALGQGIAILAIGYLGGLLFWPYALQNVWVNPLQSLLLMEHYTVSIRQIFEGNIFWSTDLPWYYLPKWFAISTPEFLMIGFLFFLFFFFFGESTTKNDSFFVNVFILFAIFFPLVYVMALKSNLYSGVRQLLFVLPLLAVLSSVGVFQLFQSEKIKSLKGGALLFFFAALMVLPVIHQIRTFPVDYIYFNAISGGNKKAWANFEYDYYFHALKKASEELKAEIGDRNVTVASNSNLSCYFAGCPNITFRYTPYLERSSVKSDYGLFGINYIHPLLLKSGNWLPVNEKKVFLHKGNPIAVITEPNDSSGYEGIQKLEAGDLDSAEVLLQKAIAANKNDVWLYVQMAKTLLKKGNFESFDRYLQQGREIFPLYEPFYLLDAQRWYLTGDYKKAKIVLDRLNNLNPYYNNAKPLRKAIEEKLKQEYKI